VNKTVREEWDKTKKQMKHKTTGGRLGEGKKKGGETKKKKRWTWRKKKKKRKGVFWGRQRKGGEKKEVVGSRETKEVKDKKQGEKRVCLFVNNISE